jgi:hypothetical protein
LIEGVKYIIPLKRKITGGKTPKKHLTNFAVPIVEHCNLRCRFCDHFAPLAEVKFADIKVFEKDFARLSELISPKIDLISLMGVANQHHVKFEHYADLPL